MINSTEQEEKQHLEEVKKIIQRELAEIDKRVTQSSRNLQEQKKYIWENKGEKNAMNDAVFQTAISGEAAVAKKARLNKLLNSPYFGRIDFSTREKQTPLAIYIGVHALLNAATNDNLVNDWRAPISSMFYDYELEEAQYEAPSGIVSGNITLKRQYRIRKSKMEFMLDTSSSLHDNILQEELSRSSDDKMKSIIATIQRDQNAIIRNEQSRVLIIQGVAGSGKTSIALHRIAFLLYRFKETISSKNILIISPNKVFADYISNVLPELGEEKIPEMGIETLAVEAFENKYKFQNFFEQVSSLLEKEDKSYLDRIRFKSTFEFLNALNQFIIYIGNEYFAATAIKTQKYTVPAQFIADKFEAYHRLPLLKRFPQIGMAITEYIRIRYKHDLSQPEKKEMLKAVTKMFKLTNLKELYKDFYLWMGKPELFKMAPLATFEYADVFPMLYLKMRIDGVKTYDHVKHLLVDEMQDYTPVQYAVLSKFFACKKTILGDASQSVNPYSSSNSEQIQRSFPDAECVKLCKSYRSTYEITTFAQTISPNKDLIAIERHGQKPLIINAKNNTEEIEIIKELLKTYNSSGYTSLGIICKTQKQAEWVNDQLLADQLPVSLLNQHSTKFSEGINITTAHLTKGLEFDQVIVPFVSAENYSTQIDKSLLYIACTRAMHQLNLLFSGKLTKYIAPVTVLPNIRYEGVYSR